MHILILGGGAVGCMLAVKLAEAGEMVTLIARGETAQTAAQQGVRLIEADGRLCAPPLRVHNGLSAALVAGDAYDLILLAVKAYDTETAAAELRRAWQTPPPILTVQNGVGNEETLATHLPGTAILAGALTTPVEVLGPAYVRIARSSYKFALAPGPHSQVQTSLLPQLAGIFAAAGFSAQICDDYRALKWSKLLMNILANAQAAILGYTPAQIFADPRLGNLEARAWREALAVMHGLAVKPITLGGYPLPLAARLVGRLPLGVVRPALGRFIAGGRGAKMPSLYYDLHPRPRARSEIPWLNGAIVTAARDLGLPVPVNALLTRVLQDIIDGRADPAEWADQPDRLLAALL